MTFEEYQFFLIEKFKLDESSDNIHHLKRNFESFRLVSDSYVGRILDVGGHPIFPLTFSMKELLNHKGFYYVDRSMVNIEMNKLPYPDNYFDTVTCFEVLEHLNEDPAFAVKEMNRVLKKDGRLIISVPNSHSRTTLSFFLTGKQASLFPFFSPKVKNHIHTREYNVLEMNRLIEEHGFKVENIFTKDIYDYSEYDYIKKEIPKALELLETNNLCKIHKEVLSYENMGDTLFCIAVKERETKANRLPMLYKAYSVDIFGFIRFKLRKLLYYKEKYLMYPFRLVQKFFNH